MKKIINIVFICLFSLGFGYCGNEKNNFDKLMEKLRAEIENIPKNEDFEKSVIKQIPHDWNVTTIESRNNFTQIGNSKLIKIEFVYDYSNKKVFDFIKLFFDDKTTILGHKKHLILFENSKDFVLSKQKLKSVVSIFNHPNGYVRHTTILRNPKPIKLPKEGSFYEVSIPKKGKIIFNDPNYIPIALNTADENLKPFSYGNEADLIIFSNTRPIVGELPCFDFENFKKTLNGQASFFYEEKQSNGKIIFAFVPSKSLDTFIHTNIEAFYNKYSFLKRYSVTIPQEKEIHDIFDKR